MLRVFSMLLLLLFAAGAGAGERKPTAGPGVRVLAPLAMPGLGRERALRVYLPPGYADSKRRYPVIYMHDGQNLFDDATSFVGEWGVDEAMDALAAEGFEAIVVGIDHGNEHRIPEFTLWPHPDYGNLAQGREYLRFLVEVVKPHVDANYRTRPGRADTAIMGSSLGALISHVAAFEHADTFSKIGEFSPSYWFSEGVYALSAQRRLPRGTRMYLLVGDREGRADDAARTVANTRRMEAQLRREQPRLRLRGVVRAGGEHNEKFWRAEFPAAVRYLFGRD
jgi:predicted alpha/beta superfamily hydrolase